MSGYAAQLPPAELDRVMCEAIQRTAKIVKDADVAPQYRKPAFEHTLQWLLPAALVQAARDYEEAGGHLRPITPPETIA